MIPSDLVSTSDQLKFSVWKCDIAVCRCNHIINRSLALSLQGIISAFLCRIVIVSHDMWRNDYSPQPCLSLAITRKHIYFGWEIAKKNENADGHYLRTEEQWKLL